MKITTFKTHYLPIDNEETYFWQCIFIPTFSIIRLYDYEWEGTDFHSNYITINFEWLFWSYIIQIDLK